MQRPVHGVVKHTQDQDVIACEPEVDEMPNLPHPEKAR